MCGRRKGQGSRPGSKATRPDGRAPDRERRGVAAGRRRLAHDRLKAGGRGGVRGGRAHLLGHAEGGEGAQEIGVLLAAHEAREAAEGQPRLEAVGARHRRAEQGEEAVEEAVVLDEVAGHDIGRDRAGAELGREAVARGLGPEGFGPGAQAVGEAVGHGGPRKGGAASGRDRPAQGGAGATHPFAGIARIRFEGSLRRLRRQSLSPLPELPLGIGSEPRARGSAPQASSPRPLQAPRRKPRPFVPPRRAL